MDFITDFSPASREFELYKLMVEQECLDGEALLSEASDFFKRLDCRYLAVVDCGKVLGVCSRSKLGTLLGSQFGFALHSRSKVRDFLEEGSMTVMMGDSVEAILVRAFSRDKGVYWHDVVVTDRDGNYVGLLSANVLVGLQSELLGEKIEHLQSQKHALEETTRALQLSNLKLEKARDAGLQAARAKSEFLAVMSHEIRTPLNGVIGMMTLLEDSELNADQRELLGTANQSAEALLLILNDILDFSRLESGHFEIETRSFEIRELVESVLTLMLESAHESGLEVVCDIDPGVPLSIVSDSGRIRQVLANLLGNAVKFTQKGRVRVGVTWEKGVGADLLRFEVEDTGIGISEEAQHRLFEPFMQADSSTTRRFGGSGLGLAICSRLASAIGGEIGVRSQVSQGSTFWFTVKAGRCEKEANVYPPRKSLGGEVALVFVKNKVAVRQIERELSCRNITPRIAHSESSFKTLLSSKEVRIDLVVCDSECSSNLQVSTMRIKAWISVYSSHGLPLVRSSCCRHAHVYLPIRPSQFGRSVETVLWEGGNETACQPKGNAPAAMLAPERSARILIVEDNPINRRLAERMVKRFGHECDLAEDGVEALEVCERVEFDLILLDCQMPRMDGYEFARRFRGREAGRANQVRRTPIVALTANALQGDCELCFAAGMDGYLTKPLRRPLLKSAIEKVLMGEVDRAGTLLFDASRTDRIEKG
ncbi:ATP-binding protein [Pelagicoccus sp. SDUM812002]|uniref:ATP-binding protein n=1 Tax=Pelagicoccus sp. SDUM812002 TaxID=3041266 RepID=UPI00280DADC6|nr:ATP-binding protein [Pelagicoccus sp. SDUM812002]MDQ8185580.1 ATP-binding protein [Pelagicoccus sp. SDUM812002]